MGPPVLVEKLEDPLHHGLPTDLATLDPLYSFQWKRGQ